MRTFLLVRVRLVAPLLAPALALTLLGTVSGARAADPVADAAARVAQEQAAAQVAAAKVAQVQSELGGLNADVEASAARLTEGTRRLEAGQAALAKVQAEAARVRRDADAAGATATAARQRLADVVGAAYQLPRPGQVAVALSAEPGELNDAVLARAELEHVQGNQQDLLREATAAGVVAAGLVRRAEQLEAEAAAVERDLAGQVAALQAEAGRTRDRLEAAAERLRVAEEASAQAQAAVEEARRLAEEARRAEEARKAAEEQAARERAAAAAAAEAARAAAAARAADAQRAAAARAAAEAAAEQARRAAADARPVARPPDAPTPRPATPRPSGGGTCSGASTSGYPNGFLPASALCPLERLPGPPAARRRRGRLQRGWPPPTRCASPTPTASTPSRSTSTARKPDARRGPGTSNHGLGVAVDLCGGAERFGSPTLPVAQGQRRPFGWLHPALGRAGRQPARALALGVRGLTSARRDQQRLRADAHRAVGVGQHAGREARPAGADRGLGVEADPLADRLAVQVHGELGVDEQASSAQVELAGDAVAAVGDREHALQRARLLTRHERLPQPGPDRRRPGHPNSPRHEPPLDRGQVAVDPPRAAQLGRLRGQRRGRGVPVGHRGRPWCAAPATRAPARPPVARAHRRLDELHAAAGTHDLCAHLEVADGHGAEQLDRRAHDDHLLARRAALGGAAQQRARRPAVLAAGVPGPGRVRRRPPAQALVVERLVEAPRPGP